MNREGEQADMASLDDLSMFRGAFYGYPLSHIVALGPPGTLQLRQH